MKISLIVPVYNERRCLPAFLEQLDALPGDWEPLFADGGSTDGSLELLRGRTCISCPKGRAGQMNFAAARATGELLWFVHCDSVLPRDAHRQLSQAAARGAAFGCFHIAFDYRGPFMGCNTFFSNLRARRGIAFGDQGIFLTPALFRELGGFPELPIMEDYELSLRLRRRGVPLVLLPGRILTSGRRYRREFPLRTMWRMFRLRCQYRAGADIREIARQYRDIR